jgi:membrane-associated phospholipid phosphatase
MNQPLPARNEIGAVPTQSTARRVIAALGPDFTLFFFTLAVMLTLGAIYGQRYTLRTSTMLLPGLIAPGIIFMRFLGNAREIVGNAKVRSAFIRESLGTCRDWLPLCCVELVFDNLEDFTAVIPSKAIDDILYNFDKRVFGEEPTVWMAKHYHPLLTDWMAFTYALFFINPMTLAVVLNFRRRREDFRELALSLIIQMSIGFFLFIAFASGPPRYYPPLKTTIFHDKIPSLLGVNDWLQGTWDTYDPLIKSALPSLHCAYGMMTLIYGWKFGDAFSKRWPHLFFWIVLPLELSLFTSTIYLRHHWIPDCIVGWMLAAFACIAAPFLRRHWPKAVESPTEAR